jgi:hypothetical protein
MKFRQEKQVCPSSPIAGSPKEFAMKTALRRIAVAVSTVLGALGAAHADPTAARPTPYLSFAGCPFNGRTFAYLETRADAVARVIAARRRAHIKTPGAATGDTRPFAQASGAFSSCSTVRKRACSQVRSHSNATISRLTTTAPAARSRRIASA